MSTICHLHIPHKTAKEAFYCLNVRKGYANVGNEFVVWNQV